MTSCGKCGEPRPTPKRCKNCAKISSAKYHATHKVARNAAAEKWKKDNPERRSFGQWRIALWRRYGLTVTQWDEMFAEQRGACKICREPINAIADVNVDHCHTSGTVRGLLCRGCNSGLGQYRDSPERLRLAAEYLETSRGAI